MPTIQINSASLSDIDRPSCGVCGSRMWMSRVAGAADGRERRTFECPVCEVSTANGAGGTDERGASPPV